MLNSPLSRSSRSSPNWHYAEPSPRISYLSRRRQSSNSNSNSKSQSPRPQVTNYVDVGIQCALLQGPEVKLEKEMAEKISQTENPVMATAPMVSGPLPITQPRLDAESPTMKRRQSRGTADEESSGVDRRQETRLKRVRSASGPVKILPAKYEHCEVEDMVILIANMISELIETNDALPPRTGSLTRFHSRTPPGISVKDYLQRLAKHATLTPPLLLSMVYYIDRLCLLYPAFSITTLTVHRFLITAATVAAKGLSDLFWNNATYARVGGVKLAELGLLELDFLYRVDWKIVPNPETLVDYYRALVDRCDGYGLESEGLSDEDDMDDRSSAQSLEDPKDGATDTKEKWKAWMADVSMQSAEKGEYQEAKERLSKKPGNAPP